MVVVVESEFLNLYNELKKIININDDNEKLLFETDPKTNNICLMRITYLLKNYPNEMVNINNGTYKAFSDKLYEYIIPDNFTNKSFCDLILFDILCRMNFKKFDDKIISGIELPFVIGFIPTQDAAYNGTKQTLLINNIKSFDIMYGYISNFEIPMKKKLILYQILYFLLNDDSFYDIKKADIKAALTISTATAKTAALLALDETTKIKHMLDLLISQDKIGCAPRTIIEGYKDGGKKSNNIEYHICKANFKHTFKKVSGTSARECAKKIAKKVLIGNKKSIKFSLKRMIGNKEKCYDYIASIEKGNIIIKNQ